MSLHARNIVARTYKHQRMYEWTEIRAIQEQQMTAQLQNDQQQQTTNTNDRQITEREDKGYHAFDWSGRCSTGIE
jgi:hypothetical protein